MGIWSRQLTTVGVSVVVVGDAVNVVVVDSDVVVVVLRVVTSTLAQLPHDFGHELFTLGWARQRDTHAMHALLRSLQVAGDSVVEVAGDSVVDVQGALVPSDTLHS